MFFVVYGTRLCGRVDAIPGLCYVATKFFHIFWIPIFPLGSEIVVEETEDGWRGVPFGLSGRSLLAGYLRGLPIGAGILSYLIALLIHFTSSGAENAAAASRAFWFGLAILPVGVVSLFLWQRPTQAQFEKICARLEIDPHAPLAAAEESPEQAQPAAESDLIFTPGQDQDAPRTENAPETTPAPEPEEAPYAHQSYL